MRTWGWMAVRVKAASWTARRGGMSSFVRSMGGRLGIAGELLVFLWRRRLWWMIPFVSILLALALLISFGSATGTGPFVYTLF